ETVTGRLRRQLLLQRLVFAREIRTVDQIVAKQQSIPVLGEGTFHHVDVMRPRARAVALDEPRVPRRTVVSVCGTPDVVVSLRDEYRRNSPAHRARRSIARRTVSVPVINLDEHVDDRLGGEPGDGRAAEVLDASD